MPLKLPNVFLDAVSPELRRRVIEGFCRPERRGGKLPLDLVLQLTVALALRPQHGIPSVLAELTDVIGEPANWHGIAPQPSSITAARDRLGWPALRALFREHAESVEEASGDFRWRGLRVAALDGTTFRAPDSPANAAAFGRPRVPCPRISLDT
ncbi:MAG: transposase domain-containing protein [Planctomycetota bacterium]